MKQSLSQRLQQKLTPQQILLMKLIQMPTTDLEARLKKEIEENPVIEDNTTQSDEVVDPADQSDEENDFDNMDYYHRDEEEVKTTAGNFLPENQQFYSLSVRESLQDKLLDQVTLKISNEKHLSIARYLIGSLDDAGYLRRDINSIVDDLAFTQFIDCSASDVEYVLSVIQELDPPGVGARDLKESLVLQLKRKKQSDLIIKNAIYILENLFEDFTHRRFEQIIEKTSISEDDLKKVLDEIKSLNPKPGEPQAELDDISSGIFPDFTVLVSNEQIKVILNKGSAPELNINKSYLEMLESYDKTKDKSQKETVQFIRSKVESARWFIDALKQREETLMKSMEAITERQKKYFLTGEEKHIKPMILKDIAEIIDMDISTVSRVVNSKYVQTPYGTFKLKKFFSESFTTESGEEVSTLQVKEILKEIIAEEDSASPKNDDEIVLMLKERGYVVARRTVAKYREQLGIQVARLRRKF